VTLEVVLSNEHSRDRLLKKGGWLYDIYIPSLTNVQSIKSSITYLDSAYFSPLGGFIFHYHYGYMKERFAAYGTCAGVCTGH